jgi:hypothetical protein
MSKLPIRLIGKGRTDVNATFFSGLRIPAGVEVFIFDSGFMSFPVLSAST